MTSSATEVSRSSMRVAVKVDMATAEVDQRNADLILEQQDRVDELERKKRLLEDDVTEKEAHVALERANIVMKESQLKVDTARIRMAQQDIDRQKALETERLQKIKNRVELEKKQAALRILDEELTLEKQETSNQVADTFLVDSQFPILPRLSLVDRFIANASTPIQSSTPIPHVRLARQSDTTLAGTVGAPAELQPVTTTQETRATQRSAEQPSTSFNAGASRDVVRQQLETELQLRGAALQSQQLNAATLHQPRLSSWPVGTGQMEQVLNVPMTYPTGELTDGRKSALQRSRSTTDGRPDPLWRVNAGPAPLNTPCGGPPAALDQNTTTAARTTTTMAETRAAASSPRVRDVHDLRPTPNVAGSSPVLQTNAPPLRHDAKPFYPSEHQEMAEHHETCLQPRQNDVPATCDADPGVSSRSPEHSSSRPQDVSALESVKRDIAQTLADAITLNRLPTQQPSIFKGDSMDYPMWRSAFALLIERQNISNSEKLLYLQRYVGGAAAEALKGYFIMKGDVAFEQALKTLDKRYGSPFVIARAFRDKLDSWPVVKNKDSAALRSLADFMQQSVVASKVVGQMSILDDAQYQKRLIDRLPDWISHKWNRRVNKIRNQQERYPTFEELTDFIVEEADTACEPVFGYVNKNTPVSSIMSSQGPRKTTLLTAADTSDSCCECTKYHAQHKSTGVYNVSTHESHNQKCAFCEKSNHELTRCTKLSQKSPQERLEFMFRSKLCFACGKTSQHRAKECPRKQRCETCKGPHLTILHGTQRPHPRSDYVRQSIMGDGQSRSNAEQSNVIGNQSDRRSSRSSVETGNNHAVSMMQNKEKQVLMTSMIVPVFVSTIDNPSHEIKTYAMLDTMSTITFIAESLSNEIGASTRDTALKLNTITDHSKLVPCQKVSGLQVRAIDSDTYVKLPDTFTTDALSLCAENVPTNDTALKHEHLKHLAPLMHPYQSDCEAGLLIGFNCAQALMPITVVPGDPHAVQTVLGWSIIGHTPTPEPFDAVHSAHRIVMQDSIVTNEKVDYVYCTKVVEATATDILHPMEQDFVDVETGTMFQEDLRFRDIVENNIPVSKEGHYKLLIAEPELNSAKRCYPLYLFILPLCLLIKLMMYCGLVLVCLAALAQALPAAVRMMKIEPFRPLGHNAYKLKFHFYEEAWDQFKTEHGKKYFGDENERRKEIFCGSLQMIEDPTGPITSTSNHALTMKPAGILPPPGVFEDADLHVRKQWRRVQRLPDEFWRLWRKDYSATLQDRRKWLKRQPNIAVGDVIILRDESTFRSDWRLAKVVEVYPSSDGLVRTCKLLVAVRATDDQAAVNGSKTTELVRPITKLTILVTCESLIDIQCTRD